MLNKPKFEEAPGLIVRRHGRDKWEARWQARSDLVARGYLPKSMQVWLGTWPTDAERANLSNRCQSLQGDMLVWARGGAPVKGFDGCVSGLFASYLSDEDSPYHKQRHVTKKATRSILRSVEETKITIEDSTEMMLADLSLTELNGRMVRQLHKIWTAKGHITMAHQKIGRLRSAMGFGGAILENPECVRMCLVLSKMKFEMGGRRSKIITAEQAIALRRIAHACGFHSIALAQAFQFELMLRQKDVIGEYVPLSEPVPSDFIYERFGQKWVRGLRWNEITISENGPIVLRHVTSKKGKMLVVDLRGAPMVMEELANLSQPLPSGGPVIISEETARPFEGGSFRRHWRKLARAAKIPDEVFNMDSRAGGISEATDAGAELEHVRHAATHSNIATTQGYSRNAETKIGAVQDKRIAHRNKTSTNED
jgi:hypothetical protein